MLLFKSGKTGDNQMKRTKQTKHTFQIESLIDPKGTYVGVFCALTGELIKHIGNEAKQAQEDEPEALQEESINPNQLQLTF
jgi:hypothetical protein